MTIKGEYQMSQENEKKTMILEFLGMDDWSRPVYKNEEGRIFKDVNCDDYPLELCTASGFDGEPNTPIGYIEKYKDIEVIITGREGEPTKEEKFNYQMLSRLKSDCDYFLGHGNRYSGRLWAGNVKDQIEEMKRLHNSFSVDKKPEWLTYNDILKYETSMTDSL